MDITTYLWKHNMTAADLARKAQVSPVALSLYRSKKKFPRVKTAKRIEQATQGEITVEELCSGRYSTDLKNNIVSSVHPPNENSKPTTELFF